MKEITKKQVEEVLLAVSEKVIKDIGEQFFDNIEEYDERLGRINPEYANEYSLAAASMVTALQMSVEIMKDTLCALLCDE